ncbi:hypothetical protein P280DRAFT_387238 [Massarina eburnea CBS 473.64]|uniref:Amino acid transporter transmembrane domain-containing protein n=1 Tax=Massarina eburnea CBS 473.64 TaxID=1395130 RepID=A0A6A6SIJ7_9PLEO|nr:hypothetical protein P280DRAFT_387238 [Massarina eburnea CBS 473.64]
MEHVSRAEDASKKHLNDSELVITTDKPLSHDPENLRQTPIGEKGVLAETDSSTYGVVSDIQNPSRKSHHEDALDASKKKITTTQAVIIFVTNEVGIGMLSLPAALNTLGFFPGILCIIVLGMLSLYTAYNLVQYWRKYPYMLNIVDYGRALGGPWVEGIFAIAFLVNMALISASAVVTLSIGINTVSEHAACTLVFTGISVIVMWAMCIPHSMRFVSWASWPCTISIVATVFVVMIALGVQGPANPDAPLNLKAIGNPTFTEATSAFLNIAFAFAGNQAFPTVLAEMENPSRDYPRAVIIEKCFSTVIYVIVACVVYALSGEQVASPALGSLQVSMAKVSYCVAFVGLLGTGLVFGMTSSRYLHIFFVRNLNLLKRGSNPSGPSKSTDGILWIFSVTLFWVVVYLIANAIPVFSSLLNISASLLLSWFTWGITVLFWFDLNRNGRWKSSGKKIAVAVLNVIIMIMVVFMNGPGLYASIAALLEVFNDPTQKVNGPFTCADNSIV